MRENIDRYEKGNGVIELPPAIPPRAPNYDRDTALALEINRSLKHEGEQRDDADKKPTYRRE
jgi:hypothetical protein